MDALVAAPVMAEAPPLPRFAQIEPTAECNLACRMCTVPQRPQATRAERYLSLARFEHWLDQLPGLETLQLQGLGEPMLNPHFFEMVALASARGIRVSTNSNLTLLTPQRARQCVSSGLDALSISLDGATRATYEGIRLQASFDKVLRNLERIVSERRRAGTTRPTLRLVMVLMRANLDELPALVDLAAAHAIDAILVQRLAQPLDEPQLPGRYIPVRTYVQAQQLGEADRPHARRVFALAAERARARKVQLHLPALSPCETGKPPGCTWPWDGLYLTAQGDLLPCCMVGTPDRASFGSVEPAGIAAVWQGERAQAFRQTLAHGAPPPSVCATCALYRGEF